MRELTKQELHDLLLGATIVSTGGGGDLAEGIELIDNALEKGHKFHLALDNEIPKDALVGTPYGCGSIAPFAPEVQAEYDKLEKISVSQETAAVKVLEKYFNKPFYGVIATELGGLNTAVALEAGALLNKPIIDADPAGRSVPCLQHTTYYLNDVSIAPMGIANVVGDTMVIPEVQNDERAEEIVRAVAVASYNCVGVVDHPGEWGYLRDALHLGTLTWCLNIGRAAREEIEAGRDFTDRIVEDFEGYHLFEGIVTETEWKDEDGFLYGEMTVKGIGDYEGRKFKVWYQNENIMSWIDDEPFVMSPDLINIVNCDDNMPLLNPEAKEGMKIKAFGMKCREEWRTEKGVEILGPKFFKFDFPFRPIEDVMASARG